MDETQVQFVNFTVNYTFIGDDVGGSIDYLETLDLSDNSKIVIDNITISKSTVATSQTTPVYPNDFVFTFSGFYGEEVAPNDTYRTREGSEFKVYNSFYDLPNFSQANTYLIDFLPDPREQVTLRHYFSSNNGTKSTNNVVVTLDGSRHLTRITAIKETLSARAEVEKVEILDRVRREIKLNREDEGLQ